ncbi:hypothetical protein V2J09_021394 [Rumex salicifolius]
MTFERKLKRGSGDVPELGAIFMSNRATKEMCLSWKTFGLPYSKANFVKQVKAGMFLFLFEYETRKLYGVYQACSDGTMNFTSDAFSSAGKKYPAQVKFKVLWYCKPLSEDEFRPAIKDNYFAAYKFKFGLSRNQVRELLRLFDSRKLEDESQQTVILPIDPSLIRGATRSPIIDDAVEGFDAGAQNQSLLENANALKQNTDLEKFPMPNRDHANADGETVLPNYRRELPTQGRVIQLRDMMHYCCKPNNDHELNCGAPYMSNLEGYDPDALLLNDITFIQQLQRYSEDGRFKWDGRLCTENAVDVRPDFTVGEVKSITRQIHVSSGMHQNSCGNRLNPLSDYCNSTPKIGVEMAPNVIRQPSVICYFEPIGANSRSHCPGYLDNAIDKVPILYNPDSGTSIQGLGRCSEAHLNTDFFRDSNISINSDNASILRQPVSYDNSSCTINQIGAEIKSIGTNEVMERQSVPPNKLSVFSRLKPALDADDECKLDDPQKSIDDMVNEVMETLKGHYSQLVRGSNLRMKKVSDDDDNKTMFKKSQTLHCEAAKYEPVASPERVFDLSTASTKYETLTGRQVNGEIPRLNFKRRSEVHKTCSAAQGEMSSAILAEKQGKRRKLVRPSSGEKKLSNKDGMVDKTSENLSFSCQPIQDGSINTDVPRPRDKEQYPPEAGNLGSLVLASSVGDEIRNGQSSNLTDGLAVVGMGSESEKHQAQPFTNPCACDARHLTKQCNLGSAVLDVSLGDKSSLQSTLNRENNDGSELSLAFSTKDGTMLENTSYGLPLDGFLDHVQDTSNNNELGGSLKDPDLPVDLESINCTLQLNFMMFSGDEKPGNTVSSDLNVKVKSNIDDDGDAEGVSTKMELGRTQYVDVAEVLGNSSSKLVELDASREELLGRDKVHEEATRNNLLAEGISARCQGTEVRYFEFLTK